MEQYREYRDDFFKGAYLPYPEAGAVAIKAMRQLRGGPRHGSDPPGSRFLPAIAKALLAENRLTREFAALRVIEAVRLYAADHDGKLPEKLSDIHAVPIPVDPGSDKPFEYHLDGQTAVLTGRMPGQPLAVTGLRYRLKIRQK